VENPQPPLLAHSAPAHDPGRPQAYADHVSGARQGLAAHADAMLAFAGAGVDAKSMRASMDGAATYHDLGKVGNQNQAAMRKGRGERLPMDHIDAGVAHALAQGDRFAAWIVRAHHAPGLSNERAENHFRLHGSRIRYLRGGRRERDIGDERIEEVCSRHEYLMRLTDANLARYLERHHAVVPPVALSRSEPAHGLRLRLALSCLADADHTDSARHDTLRKSPAATPPRWDDRIEALDRHVASLPAFHADRDRQRNELYRACRDAPAHTIASCQAPVGTGKTFAVTRYLLRQCRDFNLRRLFVVAPYTNILTQTANRLREALALRDEDKMAVVAEHHHRAEFSDSPRSNGPAKRTLSPLDLRDLATLWRAPVVLTTAVQFFETIAACDPTDLRKLHELPGSAVFIDEAHACIPVRHWAQQWRWLQELARDWSCRLVLASGSMVRFWTSGKIVSPTVELPELAPSGLLADAPASDRLRVRVARARSGDEKRDAFSVPKLARELEQCAAAGPVLCVLNTIQSAAVVTRDLASRLDGVDFANDCTWRKPLPKRRVLHLSGALTPRDRAAILAEVAERQEPGAQYPGWVLIATSMVEAGVELDFQTGFREHASVASLIQTSGRINRHGRRAGSVLWGFDLDSSCETTQNPVLAASRSVLAELWQGIEEGRMPASELVTLSLEREIELTGGLERPDPLNPRFRTKLELCEHHHDYPATAEAARIIDTDTRVVLVDRGLQQRLSRRREERPTQRELLEGSVQLWINKIDKLGMEPAWPDADLYFWQDRYDPLLLGVMAGMLAIVGLREAGSASI
jgi:CRISPR-associated endonuclease/helicase Cas3